MKSIRIRLLSTYILLILITTFTFDFTVIFLLKQYYHVSMKDILSSQAEVSANFYNGYLEGKDLHDDYGQILNLLYGYSTAQIQVIDLSAAILADSKDFYSKGDHINYPDVVKALQGSVSSWQGKMHNADGKVLAVSYPLMDSGSVVGVVRLVTSLSRVDATLSNTLLILLCITAVIITLAGILSVLLSSTIVNPVKDITSAAEKLAEGNMKVRVKKKRDDEIGKLADTLNFMADELVSHQKLKDNFIASVSHDLRTPLTSIKGWTITLKSGSLDNKEEVSQGLSIIENECDRLALLVEDFLDFSKFAAGKLSLNIDMVDIKRFIHYIYVQMKPRADRQGIEFDAHCNEDVPELKCDENRLKQVMVNLLDNAFKYTSPGGRVSISCTFDGSRVLVSVRDTGCGIGSEDLTKVKQKFYKGKNALPGSGLGLAICDDIVGMHGGELAIHSTFSEGTQVDIALPVRHPRD